MKATIVGDGIARLTTAVAMQALGLDYALFEAAAGN